MACPPAEMRDVLQNHIHYLQGAEPYRLRPLPAGLDLFSLEPPTREEALQHASDLAADDGVRLAPHLHFYSDADHPVDGKPLSCGAVILGGVAVEMYSRTQRSPTLDTFGAEASAAASIAIRIPGYRTLLQEMGIPQSGQPSPHFCDALSLVQVAKDEAAFKGSPQTYRQVRFIQYQNAAGESDTIHISTDAMVCDVGTKPLPKGAFLRHMRRLKNA